MGNMIKISCKKCSASWNVKTGMGMLHCSLEYCLSDFSKDIADEIKKNFEGQDMPHFTFSYETAVCNKCGKMVSVAVLEDLDTSKKYTAACPSCGNNDVNIIGNNITTCKCPKCGHLRLSSELTGLWD